MSAPKPVEPAAQPTRDVRIETECPACHAELVVHAHEDGGHMVMTGRAPAAQQDTDAPRPQGPLQPGGRKEFRGWA